MKIEEASGKFFVKRITKTPREHLIVLLDYKRTFKVLKKTENQ